MKPGRVGPGIDRVRDLIQARLVQQGTPSMAVAVARDGEIIWEEAFGWADRESRMAATPHTLYSLASISKPITATGIMVLVERGLVDLDQPINDYLGDAQLVAYVGSAEEATVRRVANHTAGLPTHYQFFYEDEARLRPPMEETIRRYGILVRPPGERYWYANLGYGLLDHVISRVSGQSYVDFMRHEVFAPLGMTHASVHVGPGLAKYQAARYGADDAPLPFYTFDHPGASAVWCSAHDLIRFAMFHLGTHLPDQRAILTDAALEKMQRLTAVQRPGLGYGVGWRIDEGEHGYRTVSHGGAMGGVRTLLRLVPEARIGVAVLTNGHCNWHEDLVAEILSALLPAYKARREAIPSTVPEDARPFEPEAQLLGAWHGSIRTYQGQVPFSLTFQPDGDVHAQLGEQLATLIDDASFRDGRFTGAMIGELGTEDTEGHDLLDLDLSLRGEVLNGSITATWPTWRRGRVRNALSHWIELARSQTG